LTVVAGASQALVMPPPETPPAARALEQKPTQARLWVVVFALALAMIQYLDRSFMSQAAPAISAELKLTKQQMGFVFSMFTLAYALFEIPGGYLGDRIGPRRVLLRIVTWWSFWIVAVGRAWNLASLAVIQVMFGAGEAGCFPNITKAFNRWLQPTERSRAQGVLWMVARWGGAAAPLVFYFCTQRAHLTWRMAFAVLGVVGVVWAVLFYRWFRDNPREHPSVNAAEAALLPAEAPPAHGHFQAPWSKLLRSRTVWCLGGQYAALSFCWYFFVTWFPTYLLQARHVDLKQGRNQILLMLPLLLGGIACFAAGWITPAIARRLGNVGRARKALGVFGMLAAGALLLVSTRIEAPYVAVGVIALVSFCNDITIPGAWTSCMDVGGRSVGTLGGAMNMMGNIGGALSPFVIGWIVDATNQWNLVFYVAAAVYGLGALFWMLLDPVTPLEEQVRD
jgi:sugar phosphate permease